ncbi:MAG: efflux RND transporter periplasmic adaptor subunit [Desulfobacteraceae bacterium]|nr:efflux RND transporter periplasmic adaptor subunit [Desulfobacteraceae bacterium]
MTKVTLSSHGIQMAGLQSVAAIREPFRMSIRTVGRVIADETRVRRVQTKTEGWIEKLYVNFTGQPVKKDDPILAIYSPELLSGQTEFVQAIETASKMMASSDPETRKSGESLLKSARRRLELFDVPEKFIETLKKTGKPQRSVILTAPVSGFVTAKEVFEGQKAEQGMVLFTITDLSTIWVEADFYEFEAGALRIGQDAVLSSPYQPGTALKGKIAYIYPYLNTESRTIKARLEFPNENLMLKPGMFADVSLETDLGESVIIPDSAVMDSGVRKVVFVDKGEGAYEPREVRVGARQGGKTQILSGIEADEKVVVKANFLLDSESRLQAIIQGKTRSGGGQ